MKKIISLFKRDYEGNRQVFDEIVSGAEWVAEGEGSATIKWDGTACMFRSGKLFKRFDRKWSEKKQRHKAAPKGWEEAQAPDSGTGHWPGWVPVGDGPEDKWHLDAWGNLSSSQISDTTYELIGPKIQGNPHNLSEHRLLPHGLARVPSAPTTYPELDSFFRFVDNSIEGIVWHHPDGRMVKIKRRDFGLPWPIRHETSDAEPQ
jgi:hypothetical protein